MTVLAQGNFETPVDVLNYALTLEHLEHAFYRNGLDQFSEDDFVDAGYARAVYGYLSEIRDHEAAHVETLTQVIGDLGGEPVEEAEYDFGYADVPGFVAVAQALENTGVSAYQGAAGSLIDEDALLTAALTIHGVEARHASYLNGLNGASPFPDAVNPALTPDEVLAIAGPFIVADAATDEESGTTEDAAEGEDAGTTDGSEDAGTSDDAGAAEDTGGTEEDAESDAGA